MKVSRYLLGALALLTMFLSVVKDARAEWAISYEVLDSWVIDLTDAPFVDMSEDYNVLGGGFVFLQDDPQYQFYHGRGATVRAHYSWVSGEGESPYPPTVNTVPVTYSGGATIIDWAGATVNGIAITSSPWTFSETYNQGITPEIGGFYVTATWSYEGTTHYGDPGGALVASLVAFGSPTYVP